MPRSGAAVLVCLLAVLAYGNSLKNGFAYDDNAVILRNPVVRAGDLGAALETRYHPEALEGAGLYRPLMSASFTLEWGRFGGNPLPYHLLNVAVHALISLLLFLLLLDLSTLWTAVLGASLFAVHPIHTEAVANVVGRAELYSAGFYLTACLLYWKGGAWQGWKRAFRLVSLALLYGGSLASKEMGVTLPLILLALEVFRPRLTQVPVPGGKGAGVRLRELSRGREVSPLPDRLWREAATYLLLLLVLLTYLVQRRFVLGSWVGEVPAPVFQLLSPGERILTALSLWPEYLRLMLVPLRLSSDYAPGVLFPAEGISVKVLSGLALLGALAFLGYRALRRPGPFALAGLGILWFFLTVLPVSNLLFPTGVILAERTLYLPSVGLGLVAAGVAAGLARRGIPGPGWNRAGVVAGIALILGAFTVRTVVRNPTWRSTRTVLETLNQNHPESHLAFLHRGLGLASLGETGEAGAQLNMALRLAPLRYGTLTAVAEFLGRVERWDESEPLLQRAITLAPGRDDAYRLLAAQLLQKGEGRRAHRIAVTGLARSGFNGDLWGAVSESYILKGDLLAAARAREAALSADPEAPYHWNRMGDILEALGDEAGALAARRKAMTLERGADIPRATPPGPPGEREPIPGSGGVSSDQRGLST